MIIIAILAVGLTLRLVNLNQSFWLDEAVQAITSKGTFLSLFAELRGDFHPPLYHLLMWGWAHLFGNGEIAMRLDGRSQDVRDAVRVARLRLHK